MKKVITCCYLIAIFLPVCLSAQNVLEHSLNLPRTGDRLIKKQVEYIAPGEKGLSVCWDFSKQKIVNEGYELRYFALGYDTIVGTEHRTMYYYSGKDSLFSLGFENPTTYIRNRKPELFLVFPCPYGRTFTDYFEGKGDYCGKLGIHVRGKTFTGADATGMLLLPEGDTLRNVLRIHQSKKMVESMKSYIGSEVASSDTLPFIFRRDSVDWHLENDSICMETDRWLWYAEGYRYPVFETIKSVVLKYGKPYQDFATSFYYPPQEQYYELAHDADNQMKRERLDSPNDSRNDDKGRSSKSVDDGKIKYSYSQTHDNTLILNYSLSEPAELSIALYDLQGRQMSARRNAHTPEGDYRQEFPLGNYPDGEYLLQITVDGKVHGEKIWK